MSDEKQAIGTDIDNALADAANYARQAAIALRQALGWMAPDIDTYRMGTVNIVARQAAEMSQATEVIYDAGRRANRELSMELMTSPPEQDEDGL